MRIMHIIHGFPPYFMAGSEVYTYNLIKALNKHDENFVFTRIENTYEKPYKLSCLNSICDVYAVNQLRKEYTIYDKYFDSEIDSIFEKVLVKTKPDIVHIGHLSRLSTNIPLIIKRHNIPIVFNVHDFWMFCIRGQMVNTAGQMCPAPTTSRCLTCLNRHYKTIRKNDLEKINNHMKKVIGKIDLFISPSNFLSAFYIKNGVAKKNIIHSKYGFEKSVILKEKKKKLNNKIRFGFIGRVIPSKGIHILLKAFKSIKSKNIELHIYGVPEGLKYLHEMSDKRVTFHGEFNNMQVGKALANIDVLVVPSLWHENSPLVIQEAFVMGIPVIGSDGEGVKELIQHQKNGLITKMGNYKSLAAAMIRFIEDPLLKTKLKPDIETIKSIEDNALQFHQLCLDIINDYKK